MSRVSAIPPDCNLCRLARTRRNVVAGMGATSATVMFIGEAPGRDEDARGEPFVGSAGRILNDALDRLGASRHDVFITNLVKCRPPDNRIPRRDEIDACSSHLCAEIGGVEPKVICALGQTVASELLGLDGRMADIVGRETTTAICGREVMSIVAYHPAACLYRRVNHESFMKAVEKCLKRGGML